MKKYDVTVIGGGYAGVGAAIAAAREGAKTLLIEKSGALGGAMNVNLVYPFMRYYTYDENKNPVTGQWEVKTYEITTDPTQ